MQLALEHRIGELLDDLKPHGSDRRVIDFNNPGTPMRIIVQMGTHPGRAPHEKIASRFNRIGQRRSEGKPQCGKGACVGATRSANARLEAGLHCGVSIDAAQFAQRCASQRRVPDLYVWGIIQARSAMRRHIVFHFMR